MNYEEILNTIRNTKNYSDPDGEYDFNGVVNIMLAALDNLKENALKSELEDIKSSLSPSQIEFWHKISKYLEAS